MLFRNSEKIRRRFNSEKHDSGALPKILKPQSATFGGEKRCLQKQVRLLVTRTSSPNPRGTSPNEGVTPFEARGHSSQQVPARTSGLEQSPAAGPAVLLRTRAVRSSNERNTRSPRAPRNTRSPRPRCAQQHTPRGMGSPRAPRVRSNQSCVHAASPHDARFSCRDLCPQLWPPSRHDANAAPARASV